MLLDWINKMENEIRYGQINWSIPDKENYREFMTYEEASDWGMTYYLQWANQYKKIMRLAENWVKDSLLTASVECYCGYSYRVVNEYLRNGVDYADNRCRELAHILTIVLCSAPKIPCNLVLYRLVSDDFIKSLIENNKKQCSIQEKGFLSTSLLKSIVDENEAYAGEKNLLKIYVQKDTIGAYVNAVAKRAEEEILLLPNNFLGLIDYPYKDIESGKTIYECILLKYY